MFKCSHKGWSICLLVHVCKENEHVCVHVCTHTHVSWICVTVSVCLYIATHVFVQVCVYALYVFVCANVHTGVYIHICIYVYMCVCIMCKHASAEM